VNTGNEDPEDWVELATDFDWKAVDDPESVILEHLQAIAETENLGISIEPNHAKACLLWAVRHGIPPEPLLERIALWLGSSKEDSDVTVRAAIVIREFAPLARHQCTLNHLVERYGINRQCLQKLVVHLRDTLFEQRLAVGPGGEVIRPRH
jgi:hypothetical protein